MIELRIYGFRMLILLITIVIISNSLYSHEYENTLDTTSEENSNLCQTLAISAVCYAGSIYFLNSVWYKDKQIVPFHFYNDNQDYLQVDKFGHIFGAYFYSYYGFLLLKEFGLSRTESLVFGGSLGLLLQTPIEIMDGIHEGYGFSWGDMLANTIGSGLVISQDLLFEEQIVKYKFSYWESEYSEKANGYLGTNTFDRIFKDYNGHTYWLSIPINKILPNEFTPDWLSVAVGYSANGMYGEFENIESYNSVIIPETRRYRQFLLSLDFDWTRIETDSDFLNTILQGIALIKMPSPAIELNSLGMIRFYLVYY
jgi:hypothetical protein